LTGPFYRINKVNGPPEGVKIYNKGSAQKDDYFGFDTNVNTGGISSNGWTGVSGPGSAHNHTLSGTTSIINEGKSNDVDHVVMVPIIKY
jgi:hypothetical protein